MNRLSIIAFIALTLFLATGRQSGVDGLFFGSDAKEEEDEGEPPEEAHDLVRESWGTLFVDQENPTD